MKRIYSFFLRLYPREYRELFGPEVLDVFAQAADDHRSRGIAVWLRFLATELSGAFASAANHWIDHLFSRPNRELAGTPLEKMTAAIARGDYLAARAYSIQDLKSRR